MKKLFCAFIVFFNMCSLSWAADYATDNIKNALLADGTGSAPKVDGVGFNDEQAGLPIVRCKGKYYEVAQVGNGGFFDTRRNRVVLPDTICGMSVETLSDRQRLQDVVPPTSLKCIENRAFTGTDVLTTFEDADNNLFVFTVTGDNTVSIAANDKNTLSGDIVLPSETVFNGKTYTVTSVANSGFSSCYNITSVTLPNTIESIGDYAFTECTNLANITLSNKLTAIGSWAMSGTAISHIDLPESLQTISSWSFYGCSKLEEITIPKNVESFGWGVFSGNCNALTDIKLNADNTNFVSKDGMLLSADASVMYAYAFAYPTEHLVIPETVVSLNQRALFIGNKKLKSITVPSGVTYIGEDTFSGCQNLVEVLLPDGIKRIDYFAFAWCPSLASITIPQGLTAISDGAFRGSNAIGTVTVRQNNPMEISASLFSDAVYQNATLYVPTGRAKFFKQSAGWANFSKIEEVTMEGVASSDSPYDNIEENQMVLGYYTSNEILDAADGGYGGSNAGLYKVCVRYTKEQLAAFAGNNITNIRFALLDTDILDAKLWIGSTRDKKDLYEQSLTTLKEGWNEVALSTPFAITGESIYIGIEYTQNETRWPISALGLGSEEGSCYFYGPYNGSNEDKVWVEENTLSASIQCLVEGDHIPQYDLHTTRMTISEKYLKAGENYYGYLYLRNWGKKAVSSAKIACEINGQEVAVTDISNVKRDIQSCYLYFRTGSDLTAGRHEMTFRIKDINGETPLYPADDAQQKTVMFYSQDMGRDKVLIELFTGTWCGYCPWAHKRIEEMMAGRDDLVLLSDHYGDVLSCEASESYCTTFTNYFPSFCYDRYAEYGATTLGYNISIERAMMQPSLAKLNLSAEFNEANRVLTVVVKGEKNADFDLVEGYANLTLLLTEDGVVSPQADFYENTTHYDYVHNGVLRLNVSDLWGDPVAWNGNEFVREYKVKLEDGWVKDNMNVVAFLAKPFTGHNYDEIGLVNCNDFALRNAPIVNGISELEESGDIGISVNNRSISVRGDFKSVSVYNIGGSSVANNNLQSGTYIVKVTTQSGIVVKKLVIR